MKLSVVIPAYNEAPTIVELIRRVHAVDIPKEIIVDDGSTDGTADVLASLQSSYENLRVFIQPGNRGKGAALRLGFEPEVTVKIARMKLRSYEVGISYYGRTYEEGKKIGWKDGMKALWCVLKYSITTPHSVYQPASQSSSQAASGVLDHG